MIRWVWVGGRFSWTLIGAVVFLSVSVLGFDLAWRLVKIELRLLLLYAVVADAAAAIAVAAVWSVLRQRSRTGAASPREALE
jgi:hypothetical protein